MRTGNGVDVGKGLAAGLAAGAAAAWAMEEFQALWSKLSHQDQQERPGRQGQQESAAQEKSATVQTAEVVAHAVLHRDLTEREEPAAGRLVHYAYGTTLGGLYGALAEPAPALTLGAGTAYGAAVWLVGDELLVPLLGLSKPPTQFPPSTHAYALASHLVYGLTLETARRVVRTLLH